MKISTIKVVFCFSCIVFALAIGYNGFSANSQPLPDLSPVRNIEDHPCYRVPDEQQINESYISRLECNSFEDYSEVFSNLGQYRVSECSHIDYLGTISLTFQHLETGAAKYVTIHSDHVGVQLSEPLRVTPRTSADTLDDYCFDYSVDSASKYLNTLSLNHTLQLHDSTLQDIAESFLHFRDQRMTTRYRKKLRQMKNICLSQSSSNCVSKCREIEASMSRDLVRAKNAMYRERNRELSSDLCQSSIPFHSDKFLSNPDRIFSPVDEAPRIYKYDDVELSSSSELLMTRGKGGCGAAVEIGNIDREEVSSGVRSDNICIYRKPQGMDSEDFYSRRFFFQGNQSFYEVDETHQDENFLYTKCRFTHAFRRGQTIEEVKYCINGEWFNLEQVSNPQQVLQTKIVNDVVDSDQVSCSDSLDETMPIDVSQIPNL